MQRPLTQTPAAAGDPIQVNGSPLIAAHGRIASILRSRLGQDHANLLAGPEVLADGRIAWSTAAAGEIVPIANLPDERRRALLQRAERLAGEIRGLAAEMRAEGSAAAVVGDMLEHATQWPIGEWLYSVGDKPVAVIWGHGDSPKAISTAAGPVAASSVVTAGAGPKRAAAGAGVVPVPNAELVDAAAVRMGMGADSAAAAGDASVSVGSAQPSRRSSALWLASIALALLLLGLLFWAYARYQATLREGQRYQADLVSTEAAIRSLEEDIVRKRSMTSQLVCVAPPPPPPSQTAAAPEPAPPVEAPPKVADARNMCPGERPKELAPELAIVFDASGSMALSLNATPQQIQASGFAMARWEALRERAARLKAMGQEAPPLNMAEAPAVMQEPTRITAARKAALTVAQRAPSDASIGLVLIEDCDKARSVGYFSPARRGEVLANLRRIEPVRKTPLADGVAQGARMLDGVKRDSLMVVISDGEESCGMNPCQVAAGLAKSKPRLKINVVDITGTGAGNCLARATGGKVFTARNAGEVAAMTARAAQDVMAPANCRKE